jgi:hypothetical protein
MLTACSAPIPPEPKIEIQTVKVPEPIPCKFKLPPEPNYPDSNAALQQVYPKIDDITKRLLVGRNLRTDYIQVLKQGLDGCAKLPSSTNTGQ